MPKISVIIPVFNGARFVGGAIRSVLAQTFQDLELIVVDDGSTDETGQVAGSFCDPRLSYIYQLNRGPNAARNTGIQRARGELFGFLDCDDWWLPEKVEAQLKRLACFPEAGLVYCSTLKVDEGRRLLKHRRALIEGSVLEQLLLNNEVAGPSSVVIPRHVLEEVGLFDETLWRAEDWDMWLRIAARFPVAAVKAPLACITYRHDSHGRNIADLRDDCLTVLGKAFSSYASHLRDLQAKAIAKVHLGAGIRYGTIGQLPESRSELIKSLQIDPSNLGAYWRLMLTFLGPAVNRRGRSAKEAIRLRILARRARAKGLVYDSSRLDP